MFQEKVKSLIGEITQLAIDVTTAKRAIVFTRYAAHVNTFEIEIDPIDQVYVRGQEKLPELYRKDVRLAGWLFENDLKEAEERALNGLYEMKEKLLSMSGSVLFYGTWQRFQKTIEQEILLCIHNGWEYTPEILFDSVFIPTEGNDLSLGCMYEALNLSGNRSMATTFKEEMFSNIEWLDNQIHANLSDYESEVI